MSDSELLEAIKVAESQDTLSGNLQQALKILLNSGYGAVGNEWFLYYVIENAESITASGQLINKWTHKRVNELLDTIVGTSNSNRTIAGDTDSVVGSTMIDVNGVQMAIADYYDSVPNNFIKNDTFNNDFVKLVSGDNTQSVNADIKLERKPITYVMKHKVKKRMYKLTVNGESVTVTEDHSLIVLRRGELKSVKPANILKGDKMIKVV